MTKKQQQSLLKKYQQNPDGSGSYLQFRRRAKQGFDCVMIQWCDMWLGIEKDGYTHS